MATNRKDIIIYAAVEPEVAKTLKADAKKEKRSTSKQAGIVIQKWYDGEKR